MTRPPAPPAASEASRRDFRYEPGLVPDDFAVTEVFGYPPECDTEAARDARDRCWCPFRNTPCSKLKSSAKTGVCSVRYKAEGFEGPSIWAVCQHRLSGEPFREVLTLHFGDQARDAELVPEVRILDPTMSFDAVGVLTLGQGDAVDIVGIEAQTIDTRGGAIQPMWRSYVEGRPDDWRGYYERAEQKPAFGVNTTNVWKRLLPQVMNKGRLYRDWESKLYVVLQDSVYAFITRRMRLRTLIAQERDRAEIVWVRWDYTGRRDPRTGQLESAFSEPIYTTAAQVEDAFVRIEAAQRPRFVAAVLRKRKRDRAKLAGLRRRMEAEAARVEKTSPPAPDPESPDERPPET